jgi:hypothetical protein
MLSLLVTILAERTSLGLDRRVGAGSRARLWRLLDTRR